MLTNLHERDMIQCQRNIDLPLLMQLNEAVGPTEGHKDGLNKRIVITMSWGSNPLCLSP